MTNHLKLLTILACLFVGDGFLDQNGYASETETYWTVSQCSRSTSDNELKPAIAAELEQYAEQFTTQLIKAIDQANAGDFTALQQLRTLSQTPVVAYSSDDVKIETASVEREIGALPLRIYSPTKLPETKTLPVVIYFHGGGWVLGSASGTDSIAMAISRCRSLPNTLRTMPGALVKDAPLKKLERGVFVSSSNYFEIYIRPNSFGRPVVKIGK